MTPNVNKAHLLNMMMPMEIISQEMIDWLNKEFPNNDIYWVIWRYILREASKHEVVRDFLHMQMEELHFDEAADLLWHAINVKGYPDEDSAWEDIMERLPSEDEWLDKLRMYHEAWQEQYLIAKEDVGQVEPMTKDELIEYLTMAGACEDAIEWINDHPSDEAEEIYESWPDENSEIGWLSWFEYECDPTARYATSGTYFSRMVERAESDYLELHNNARTAMHKRITVKRAWHRAETQKALRQHGYDTDPKEYMAKCRPLNKALDDFINAEAAAFDTHNSIIKRDLINKVRELKDRWWPWRRFQYVLRQENYNAKTAEQK